MRKLFYLLAISLLGFMAAKANPGDTTIVQAQNGTNLTYYGNYDTGVQFPHGKTYRKIYMEFTLGKYHCPIGSTYCGDWDYTVLTYLMSPKGDTFEIGRLITPYANAANPSTPWTWTQRYYFDVTDFYPLLQDSNTIRILYSGYSGGFTANIKFIFIEGTPERNVTGIKRLWTGSYVYGSSSDPINNHFPTVSLTAPAGTQSAALKFTVTGHGHDDDACSEFCEKYYNVTLNGSTLTTKNIWRDNCGFNELYPQSGTWIYNRGNWCPGALVYVNTHPLPGITAGSNFNVGVNFEPYTSTVSSGNSSASYTTEGAVFYYGGFNNTLDASLEDVIAPTSYEGYKRENPLCGTPSIKVRNSGSTTINSIQFQYGVTGAYLPTYTWNGTLAPLQDTTITLPEPWQLRVVSGTSGIYNFVANIVQVNGTTDNDATNNTISTYFAAAPTYFPKLYIYMTTDSETLADGVTSEFDWKIYDLSGNIVAQRVHCAPITTYKDTVILGPSCYKLVVEAQGCDGLNGINAPYVGSGSFLLKSANTSHLTTLSGYYNGDFGCGFTQYFTTAWPLDAPNIYALNEQAAMETYPNPARSTVHVDISGLQNVSGTAIIYDAIGRQVAVKELNAASSVIDVSTLANGLYTIAYIDKVNPGIRLTSRILVAK